MTIIDKCQKQCPSCKINIRLSHNKTPDLDIYQSHLFSKVEQDNEIQPPESRDAIGKLSNKKQ